MADTTLEIRCAWCDKFMGTKPGQGQTGVTHSICDECKGKYFPEQGGKKMEGPNPPEWYKKAVTIARLTDGATDKFITQANATIELAKQCQLHPFLHSFIDLNDIREDVLKALGQAGQLYVGGDAEKFLVDSAFDEIIDTIVENLGNCPPKIVGGTWADHGV